MEITNRDDLRVGDIATFAYDGHEFTGPLWSEVGNDLAIGDMLVRLPAGTWLTAYTFVSATREVPNLPTETGAVILVTECRGERLDPPVLAVCDGVGYWHTRSHYIDDYTWHAPYHITEWTPAKVVPA